MRKIGYFIVLSLLIFTPILLTEDTSSGGEAQSLLFFEINPFGSHEGVSLFNYGAQNVDLKGWSVSDGEGTLTFVKSVIVAPGTRFTIVKSIAADDWFSGRDRTVALDDVSIEKKGSFILADAGDDVYLYRNGVLIDSVCYGNKYIETGWKGDPVHLPSSKYLLRVGSNDTDTLADWIATKPGLTNRSFDPELYFDARVMPFSFPESCGTPIFRELEGAESEVLISIYLLTSVPLAALLCDLASSGVTVRIILEGDVLGIDTTTELTLMRSIVDAGGNVYLINDPIPGNYERFSYFHNKYAVIDGREVIVTSENWTAGNMSSDCSNRGWGAVIESEGLAEYMREVFFSDLSPEYGDVRSLMSSYPGLKAYPGTMTYSGTEPYETAAFDARVMPVLSPDNSWSALEYFMGNAEIRVYSQQLDLGSSLRVISEKSPMGWMSAAADRGVDVKFILDASSGDSKEETINLVNNTTGIKALYLNGRAAFSLIHNKGIVMDDIVWVGSVNWTENSFMNNREFAVVIDSPEVTEFFAGLFIEDWGVNEYTIEEMGLEITHEVFSADGEQVHVFTVSGPEHSEYTWDVLGDGVVRRSEINRIVCRDLPAGTYTISVTMDGTAFSVAADYSVTQEEKHSQGKSNNWAFAAAGMAGAAGVGFIFRRRYKGR